jgi:ABC-type oligopeptide transport system ATPase subunit
VQAQVMNILAGLKARFGLTHIFISHNLTVVQAVSDRVAVMYFGHVVERGPAAEIFARVSSVASAPVPGKRSLVSEDVETKGRSVQPAARLSLFSIACPRGTGTCRTAYPPLETLPAAPPGHRTACLSRGLLPQPALT